MRRRCSFAPSDHDPPPSRIRNISAQNIAKSVRASLTMYQKPWFGRSSSGIFVVPIAVVITTSRGTADKLVQSPSKTRSPQAISNEPTNNAVKCGCENPIRVKRSTPIFGSMNFRMPCVKKISPTGRRIQAILAVPGTGRRKNRRNVDIELTESNCTVNSDSTFNRKLNRWWKRDEGTAKEERRFCID